ncbi:UbiA family prenyltransferase [Flavivirga sp. 57AJ16]|uniref:UbiA family prenyltransferase n=1 Tax=Flavivirga sp. 57AJ16 TaxID=3025307 RepID=UPI00236738CD|nr:UbiA family prenyltransferase [Flavivirga sp. 57AJ16]MDD7887617.1 UbiA family prenyltransferase [Flavivirga sp. 57AJ16]
MIKIPKVFRLVDWWEPKIVPLLFLYYLTAIQYNEDLIAHFGWMIILIVAIAIGAIYVSILNDYTDLKFDLASKKANRLEKFSPTTRKLILLSSILLSVSFCFLFINDTLSLTLYLSAYLVFSLYSIPPFRFKNRGILGVIADASGSHLFPSLLVVSYISNKFDTEIEPYWFILIGVWAFTYGLRGILWHQFWDRENDLSINHKTFATCTNVSVMKPVERLITLIELSSLFLILFHIESHLPIIALILYFLILIGYNKKLKIKSVMVLSPNGPYHIFMTEFYLVLLPLSLIVTYSIQNPICWILVFFHLLFFPASTKLLIRRVLLILGLKKS